MDLRVPSSQESSARDMTRLNQFRLRIQPTLLRKLSHGVSLSEKTGMFVASAPLTETQRRHVVTGFILGIFSIMTAFFPVCGLPFAIAGLLIGVSNRRITALRTVVLWGIGLSTIGLVLTVVNIIVAISIYFSTYFWGTGG